LVINNSVVDPIHDNKQKAIPRHYDVIGDVALLHALPAHVSSDDTAAKRELGAAILKKNPRLRLCVLRQGRMVGDEKKHPIETLAGKERVPVSLYILLV
jgi:tRNA G37 N-methylase Trm5